jgi:hypothetical protein
MGLACCLFSHIFYFPLSARAAVSTIFKSARRTHQFQRAYEVIITIYMLEREKRLKVHHATSVTC